MKLQFIHAAAVVCPAFLSVSLFAAEAPTLRLPDSVAPVSYQADLTLDPQSDHFSGVIEIKLNIKKPVSEIWLNQNKINVESATLTAGGKSFEAKAEISGQDFLGLRLDSEAPTGDADLRIKYTGDVIQRNSSGLFRMEDAGSWYLFSQFEATDARAAFPCFDEPSYKVPWQLTLHVPAADKAISNTPSLSDKVEGAMRRVEFKQTKPLPSYLIAVAVGPFDIVEAGHAGRNNVPVRIIAPKGKANEAKYAAEVSATILTRLEDYFGIPYAYEKLDNVAIPVTFGFGAMENAGMITYAQTLILAKPEADTIGRKRGYASVAAHEMAHQWFGDLVTTDWWNDIWLNEAFATWMSSKLIAEWKPEWKTRVDDVDEKLGAAAEDSLISARKIRQEIVAKDDINNAFDSITYQKGAAVIRMFENWMGEAEFRKGVQSYIKQYSFRNATAGDFLDSLSSASKKDVTSPFSTFLNQAGVPLLSTALDCGSGGPVVHLEQQRFLPLGSKGSSDETWRIPVCVSYGSGDKSTTECTLLTDKKTDWKLKEAKSCPEWLQPNANAVGYYRMQYADQMLAKLTSGDADKRLNAPERSDLLGNAEALTSAGRLPADNALLLAEKFHDDPVRQVTLTSLDLALTPEEHLVAPDLYPNFQRFIRANYGATAHKLGWTPKPDDSDDTKLLRPAILRAVSTWGGDEALAQEAKTLANKWLEDHASLDPNLVNAVLGTAAFNGDKAFFDRLLADFKKTQDRQIRGRLLNAMASFQDPEALQAGMTAVLNGEVPFLEGARMLFAGQGQARTRKLPLEFLKAHYDEIVKKMPTGGGFDFGSVLPRVGQSYCDEQSKAELKSFFEEKNLSAARHALDEVLEGIDVCIAGKQAQEPSVEAFLKKY